MKQPDIAAFFAAYSERLNAALHDPAAVDAEASASAFADCFIEASPRGVICGHNDESFRQAIPQGIEFYRSIGTQRMLILTLETGELREGHYLARVFWRAQYLKEDGSSLELDFDVVYLLQVARQGLKIFAYVTGDEQEAYRRAGLV